MISQLIETQTFGILLTIAAYAIGTKVNVKYKHTLTNPLIVAVFVIIGFLSITNIPYSSYKIGGDSIHYFLGPVTVALGLMLYRQRQVIAKYSLGLIIGISTGVLTSFVSIIVLGKILNVDALVTKSVLPKSITTPMALSLVEMLGGNPSITVFMVVVTGMTGALLAPFFVRVFPGFHKIAIGVGIGTAAHALGTSKAIELGETEGALSSAAIGLAGLFTILLVPPLYMLIH